MVSPWFPDPNSSPQGLESRGLRLEQALSDSRAAAEAETCLATVVVSGEEQPVVAPKDQV